MVTAASRTVLRARIASIATYLPPKVLTNADLEKMVETTDEWILQRTGIRERHIAAPGVGTSDLAYEASKKAIERAGLTPADISLIIPHQANIRIVDAIRQRLGLPPERAFLNLHKYGNTSGAAIAIALDEAVRTGAIKKGDNVLLVAFGAGFAWAASVIRW